MDTNEIIRIANQVLAGGIITQTDAMRLTETAAEDIPLLAGFANKIRHRFAGDRVDMCGVVNARSGLCTEDCKFCAQSVHHHTDCLVYPLKKQEEIIAAFQELAKQGAGRASVVTSGKGMEQDPDFTPIKDTLATLASLHNIKVCANIGTITPEQAAELAAAGVTRYAHNLETSEHFYPSICTSHPYHERYQTLLAAKAAGMELCSGGIIGLGETWQDRVDLALLLRDLDAASIPINILNPIPGTALEKQKPLTPLEIIKTFAIFRFILPSKVIRPAGGREINLRDLQGALLLAGANGLIIGNYLTFSGRDIGMDFCMVNDAGLTPA